jgi:L-ascorbate metabolism protein UlaG (beta-lactamase superfamily)
MTITKFGHCCLLLEVEGKRILVDPGRFTTEQNELTAIDIILITHEHADHYHSESMQVVTRNNPNAVVITNSSVARLLTELGVTSQVLEGDSRAVVLDISLQAHDGDHVEIVGDFGIVQNTGYMINEQFFFPGDAYTIPEKTVDILALPVAGLWCKVSDAISYAKTIQPRVAFPVHDATLSEVGKSVTYPHFTRELASSGVSFLILEHGVATRL